MDTIDATLIRKMFDKISSNYDFINNLISFGTHRIVKKYVITKLNIKPNSKVLDLCCGSGDLGEIIKQIQPSCDVIGVDFSPQMIEIARKRNQNITYWEADATMLPFEKNSFDYVVMGFGLRNIEKKNKALDEIHRILKTNGSFLHLDFAKTNRISRLYDSIILLLSKLFIKDTKPLKYLVMSKNRFLSDAELIELFTFNKLKCVNQKSLCLGIISFQISEKL